MECRFQVKTLPMECPTGTYFFMQPLDPHKERDLQRLRWGGVAIEAWAWRCDEYAPKRRKEVSREGIGT